MADCAECGLDKELTTRGVCWKCQVSSVSAKGKCKSCSDNVKRIAQKVTSSVTFTPEP